MRNAKILLLWSVLGLCLTGMVAEAQERKPAPDAVTEGWLWKVAVFPPSEGWESPAGKSIWAALRMAASESNERRYGLENHDVEFLQEVLPPLEDLAATLRSLLPQWRREMVVGVFSFAGTEIDRVLVRELANAELPVLLGFGEDVVLRSGDVPLAHAFALDLYRRFRVRVLAEHATRGLDPAAGITVLGDRLDPYLAGTADLLIQDLLAREFAVLPLWAMGAGDRDLGSRLREAVAVGATVLVSALDTMGTLDAWRFIREEHLPLALWYLGDMNAHLAQRPGIVAADQRHALAHDPTLRDLRGRIFDSTRFRVPDTPSAARAYALAWWFFQGVEDARGLGAPLLAALARSKNIPLGEERPDIDPVTHRPLGRMVTVFQSDGASWRPLMDMRIRSRTVPE